MRAFFVSIVLWLSPWSAVAQDVDYVALASQLVRDGHYDRAESVLANVVCEPSCDDGYHVVRGILDLKAGRLDAAETAFLDALGAGNTDPSLYVFFAQVYWGKQDWKMVVQSVANAQESGRNAALQTMRVESLKQLGRHDEAFSALTHAEENFGEAGFARQRIVYLAELGLYQTALEHAQFFFQRGDATADDYLLFGESLQKSGASRDARVLLEEGRLKFPDHPGVLASLARAWADTGSVSAAADLMQRASALDPRFVTEAADLYRRAGAFERALFMNAQIEDQAIKLRQRVAILVDLEDFEAIAAMESRLTRVGLLDEDALRYALAYAAFKLGAFETCQGHLQQLTSRDFFDAATQLRAAMAYCGANPLSC